MLATPRTESGDETFLLPLAPRLICPPPANDNHVAERPRIVGLIGYAGSGKSTAASVLVERGYIHTKFAGPLKGMLRQLYQRAGVSGHELERRIEGDLKEEADPILQWRTPRQAMQWLGTDWGRAFFGDDFWVDLWAASLLPGVRYVVDDCRFANEAAAIRERGGMIIRVDRPGVGPVNNHVSELMPITPDFVLKNSGSIADLRVTVNDLAA